MKMFYTSANKHLYFPLFSNITKSTIPLTDAKFYTCTRDHGCDRNDAKENNTWGYYTETNKNIVECKHKCDNDKNCGGVEIGKIDGVRYCSWWLKRACSTLHRSKNTNVMTCLVGGRYFNQLHRNVIII